jgi:hypothetical protein
MHRHGRRRERPFRYENMWNRHETYESTVAAAWIPGCSSLEALHANLQGMQVTLSNWEREQFGSVRHELISLRRRLEEVRARSLHTGPLREERALERGTGDYDEPSVDSSSGGCHGKTEVTCGLAACR